MTLENFFTSTELKNGLTTPSRVNELLTVMQNEKENIIKTISDAARQWSAVAIAIAATENKECIDLFIKLDGLWFIDKWLKDAQNLINDGGNDGLDELIIGLLRSLERLQVDHHLSVGSGIGLTVQGLVGHSSLAVHDKAKGICDKWALVQNNDVDSVANSSGGNDIVENVEQAQQETNNKDVPTREIIMESETEIVSIENNILKSENVTSTEIEERNATTETMEDIIDKDEEMVEGGESQSPDHGKTATEIDTASGIGESASGSGSGGLKESGDADDPKTTSGTDSDEADDEDEKKDDEIESDDDSGSRTRVINRSTKSQDDNLINKRPSDMELDYGMVDPLELARQVANEVELEVDSQEQSCSASTNEKESGKEVSSGPGPGPSSPTTQINGLGQEPGLNPEKGFSGFDLNEEITSDEIEPDRQVDQVLTPIPVVSASRAAAADGLPVTPLQFEGHLGWKGSAATSAFRRIPEGEKTYSSSSSHNNSNPRMNHFDFDLNVTEASDDKTLDFLSRDKAEESSRLELDLNSLGDGVHNQLSYKNVDLNLTDRLSFQNNSSLDNNQFLGKQVNNSRDESVISIFGTQVEVNRNDYIPRPSNGKILEPSVDFSLGRPGSGNPYANLPAYGYGHNGFATGPIYGPPGAPIPYMVDSRGSPIIPPIMPAFSQPTQPFFFNMAATGAPSGSNGAGPSRNSLDLNPGFVTEMGNRENININNHNVGLRQFFNHNQASSSSVIGGKREEPDSGWDFFPVNYKHQPPPWQ